MMFVMHHQHHRGAAAPETAADRVYRAIQDAIFLGQLRSGERLVHRELAKRFETSNTPVIDALRRLERDGLVQNIPNWGARVRAWTPDDMEAAFRIRETVEGYAARLFARKATRADRVQLEDLALAFEATDASVDRPRRIRADVAFHGYIVDRAECDYLRHVSETARPVCFRFLEELSRETAETAHRRTAAEHRAIVAALEQSEDAAESAMRAHVAGARERLVTALRETEGATAPSGAMP